MTLLSLENVRKTYAHGRHEVAVLEDISLQVDAGEFVAIYGGSRSGKSILLRLAAGLERPTSGTVFFKGRDLSKRRRGSGLLGFLRLLDRLPRIDGLDPDMAWARLAGPSRKSWSMIEYVSLPLLNAGLHRKEAEKQATELLEEIGIDHLARRTWRELTETDRILMTVAHAVIRRPALLLADDVTRGLGAADRQSILALLRTTADADGMAVLMTTSDTRITRVAHTKMTLSDRRLVRPRPSPTADIIPLPGTDARSDTA
jgi:ABC-type lipoprotein export system ATPase subunit